MTMTLQRQTFHKSRALEYFSEKELTLQTGHEPERWPEVVLKELIDNALDACEEHSVLPAISVTVADGAINVTDNGPGLRHDLVRAVLDFGVRVSSKDAYISPTRGAQGNALKTILAIPYVRSGGKTSLLTITSRGTRHAIQVDIDRIAQEPQIRHVTARDRSVKNGTRVEVALGTLSDAAGDRFLPMIQKYSLFNPHACFELRRGPDVHYFKRTASRCAKWRPSDPTSAHWYTPEQLRHLIAAYVAAERRGAPARTVRDFVAEFRGLSSTVKRKAVLTGLPVAGVNLRDLVRDGDIDAGLVARLLKHMQAGSTPVKPLALGVLGEDHLRAWLRTHGSAAQTVKYKRLSGLDDTTGLPFVVELAFAGRQDRQPRQLLTGINFAPTLADPFRTFRTYGLGLDGLLNSLHVSSDDPVTVVLHLASPHLHFTDRGKASLEAV